MFINQSQSRIVFSTNHIDDIMLYKCICPALQVLFLLPAVMRLKMQIKMYQRLLSEIGRKYDVAEDFISCRRKELCLEHAILEEEVCLYIFFMLRIQFSY